MTRQALAGCTAIGLLSLSAILAPAASGQGRSTLVLRLKQGVSCAEPAAANQLLINADAAGASLTDLLGALDDLSIDTGACIQIRDAASALAAQLNHDNPTIEPADTDVADLRVQQALAEAEQRVASMRFEVGPPPRNLTRNRGGAE